MIVEVEESGETVHTESVHSDTGIVDHEVDALVVRLLQVFGEIRDAGLVGDIQVVILDLCKSAVRLECFGLVQLRVLLELLQRSLASALVTRCEVDEERSVVEG